MWMKWWWVAVAALLAVILPPSNATLSPAGINYEGTYPALLLISKVLTKCPTARILFRIWEEKRRMPNIFNQATHVFFAEIC
jgi:hypothetical protein